MEKNRRKGESKDPCLGVEFVISHAHLNKVRAQRQHICDLFNVQLEFNSAFRKGSADTQQWISLSGSKDDTNSAKVSL